MKEPSNISASFLTRFRSQSETPEKIQIGQYVARTFLSAGDRFFAASGTTVCCATLEILSALPDLLVCTHSVPLMFFYLELVAQGKAAPFSVVETLRGPINPTTGVIATERLGKLPTTKLLIAPHGISKEGFNGNRDVEYLQAVLAAHTDVFVLSTWGKFQRAGNKVVKHMGHIRKECFSAKRKYRLIVPEQFPADIGASRREECLEFLEYCQHSVGMEVHRV